MRNQSPAEALPEAITWLDSAVASARQSMMESPMLRDVMPREIDEAIRLTVEALQEAWLIDEERAQEKLEEGDSNVQN